jgi:hypothetical protein
MNTCESCGIKIAPGPESVSTRDGAFCCAGCARGGPCVCTYEHDLGRYPPSHYAKPISLSDLLDRYEKGVQREIEQRSRSADGKDSD